MAGTYPSSHPTAVSRGTGLDRAVETSAGNGANRDCKESSNHRLGLWSGGSFFVFLERSKEGGYEPGQTDNLNAQNLSLSARENTHIVSPMMGYSRTAILSNLSLSAENSSENSGRNETVRYINRKSPFYE